MKETIKNQKVEVTRKMVGERLKEQRWKLDITREKEAEIIGVTPYQIYKWEKGKNWPTIPHLVQLAELFECSETYLVLGHEYHERGSAEDQIGLQKQTKNVKVACARGTCHFFCINRVILIFS